LKQILFNKEENVSNLKKLFKQNSIEAKFEFIQSEIKLLKSSFQSTLAQKVSNSQNELEMLKRTYENNYSQYLMKLQNSIDLLKNNFELNHPDKKDKNGFVQISKENKIVSLDNLEVGDIVSLQSPKYIAMCTINNLKKQ